MIFLCRYCDIDLLILATSEDSTRRDVHLSLHREYTAGCLPDWMVTRYSVQIHNKRFDRK